MAGETDLSRLLDSMSPVLSEDEFVFCTVPEPPDLDALCVFHEDEGFTLICRRGQAERLGLPFTFPCRRITLTIHSSLEAVGFLAAIAAALARRRIPVNVVSAYFHDYLFVPTQDAESALAALRELQRAAQL
jgi:hypothetical protein